MAVIGDGLSISQVAEKVGMPLTISHTGRATRAVHFGRDV